MFNVPESDPEDTKSLWTKKTAGKRKTYRPQILLCDIQINILPTMYRNPTTQNVSDLDFWPFKATQGHM